MSNKIVNHDRGWQFAAPCPGCGISHVLDRSYISLDLDSDSQLPTFTPEFWEFNQGPLGPATVCRGTITAGVITFFSDCPHELAGQQVEMIGA